MEQRLVHPRRSSRVVLGGLGLVAALALSGCSSGGTPSAPPAPQPAQPQAAKPTVAPAPAPPVPPPYVYEAKDRRDPFRPLVQPKPAATRQATAKRKTGPSVDEIKLTGVIWDGRGACALVEAANGAGYVLRVNDTVGEGARVARITPEMVTIEVKPEVAGNGVATRKVELRLRKEE